MRILVVANFSDVRCGFRNVADQTVIALQRTGHEVTPWDGTYPAVYARQQLGQDAFFPPDVGAYDVVHVIWNALTLNHYAGADWSGCRVTSWWDGGPSDASCPFKDAMQIRWSDYPRDGYHYLDYPVPDWVTDLPTPPKAFTIGMSSVRGDGVAQVQAICEQYGWAFNGPTGQWLSIEDEIKRLARSSLCVCWYRTPPIWHNRASAPSMLLASGRPLLVNEDPLVAHLRVAPDVYHSHEGMLEQALLTLENGWKHGTLNYPVKTADQLSWTRAADAMVRVWKESR